MDIAPIPLDSYINSAVLWMHLNLGPIFETFKLFVNGFDAILRAALEVLPEWAMIILIGAVTWARNGIRKAVIIVFAAALISNLGLWDEAMDTVSLLLISAGLSIAIGIPLGVLCAESERLRAIITPVADFMQTTPAFVYLIPSVMFFSLGAAPGVFATMMFAMPPALRATQLGIMQVSADISEAGEAFGSSRIQLLTLIKLPLALPFIYLGVNQCIMMSLNVVVIAALIGAPGLGAEVVTSLAQMDLARGIEAGAAIVLVALIIDGMTSPSASNAEQG